MRQFVGELVCSKWDPGPQWDPSGKLEKPEKWNLGPYWNSKTGILDLSGTLAVPSWDPLFIYLFIYLFTYLFIYLFVLFTVGSQFIN